MFSFGMQVIAYKMWVRAVLSPMSILMMAGMQTSRMLGDTTQSLTYGNASLLMQETDASLI